MVSIDRQVVQIVRVISSISCPLASAGAGAFWPRSQRPDFKANAFSVAIDLFHNFLLIEIISA
nr:hypothetical protein TR92_02400 [Brucella anthropi]